ncbi:MAG TPA: M1 family metallopeptidase [Gemmatimonadaceae bacterium]|nr:M1 family metallopeptidase [Gemmatimonadaceae bacterium]
MSTSWSRSGARAAALLLSAGCLASSAATQPNRVTHTYRPAIDALHYDLTIMLPDTGARIAARATLELRRAAGADTVVLDLLDLTVDSVAVNGRAAPFTRDSVSVRIAVPVSVGDSLQATVWYGGIVRDGLIIRRDSATGEWTAFGDNWPNRARHWIPSIDHPSDKATVTWTVEAPSTRTVIANGVLVEETPLTAPLAGRTRTVWHEGKPIPTYLMVIGAARLAMLSLGQTACGMAEQPGCVPQSVYLSPELRDYAPGPFADAGAMVAFFGRIAGPYPYEKLAHVQSATRFGGMENATAIFYSDGAFRRRSVGTTLIAHETAHQWFGNAVTGREWAHLWLSEGFATYFAALWTEHSRGDSAMRASMQAMRRGIIDSEITAQRPVIDTAQTNLMALLNTNSYQKGGFTLHMLRAVVGDSAFFQAIRAYYAAHVHETALTDDFARAAEQAHGQPLGWFFDQWLRRPGYAEVSTSWSYDASARRVLLQVRQGGRWPPYRFPLAVVLRDTSGTERRVTVEVGAEREQRLTLPVALDRAPAALLIDPDAQLLGTFTTH